MTPTLLLQINLALTVANVLLFTISMVTTRRSRREMTPLIADNRQLIADVRDLAAENRRLRAHMENVVQQALTPEKS